MPAERAPMRKVREVLRLRHALGVSERQIAITVGVGRSTIGEYLRRAAVIGITWPVPEGLDDGELERRLFTPPTFDEKPGQPLPDWSYVFSESALQGADTHRTSRRLRRFSASRSAARKTTRNYGSFMALALGFSLIKSVHTA